VAEFFDMGWAARHAPSHVIHRRSSARFPGPPGFLRVPPIDPFEQVAELLRRDAHAVADRRRPQETAALEALGVKRQAEPIMPKAFDKIAAAPAEDVKIAGVRIALEAFLDQQRQPVHAAAHVGVAGGDPKPARPRGPGSSPVQDAEHAGGRIGVDSSVHHHTPTPPTSITMRPLPALLRGATSGFGFGAPHDESSAAMRRPRGLGTASGNRKPLPSSASPSCAASHCGAGSCTCV